MQRRRSRRCITLFLLPALNPVRATRDFREITSTWALQDMDLRQYGDGLGEPNR